jgi:hypothetical protein
MPGAAVQKAAGAAAFRVAVAAPAAARRDVAGGVVGWVLMRVWVTAFGSLRGPHG